MRIGVLGTGVVGHAIGTKLAQLGHEVKMGSRQSGNEKAVTWARAAGEHASEGSFEDAAAFGEVIVNCTAGVHSLAALGAAGAANLTGKLLVDLANPLDYSSGMPPTLAVCNTSSLGEQIQSSFSDAKVVKALNTVTWEVMVEPARAPGDHVVFVCGEDADAKSQVSELLESFGWPPDRILDLGGIRAARGAEMYLPLLLTLSGELGTSHFNIAVLGASG